MIIALNNDQLKELLKALSEIKKELAGIRHAMEIRKDDWK